MSAPKKTFGKNLNKLVQPENDATNQQQSQQQQDNGLLLLSATQKKSALLSNKGTTYGTTGNTTSHTSKAYDSTTVSTHDVLLSAVTGKTPTDQRPDAWGATASAAASATGIATTKSQTAKRLEDQQVEYMAQKAKERAAAAKAEEEERMREQKERAIARLRELESKQDRPVREQKRTLWEPNDTPTGNSNNINSSKGSTTLPVRGSEVARPTEKAFVEASPVITSNTDDADAPRSENVIHLNSYEDRDRGERPSAAPRMLYDPKSGSMVKAVEPRQPKKPRPPRSNRRNTNTTSTSTPAKKKKRTRLPRTCGVLYERTGDKGFKCADGIEGDLGYGCHSVPGGCKNNPEAYAEYMKIQNEAKEHISQQETTEDYDYSIYNNEGLALQTGFQLEEKPTEPMQPEPLEWISADDKLELVTGQDDSPTLKPTAKAWAPNQAAIAAATAAKTSPANVNIDSEDEREEGFPCSDNEDSEDGAFGLGFDPTKDMDGLIHSPGVTADSHEDPLVDLDALRLGPKMLSDDKNGHIFAFGTAGTWGAKSTPSESADWGTATSALLGGLTLSGDISGKNPNEVPTSSTNTWGGLSGLSLGDPRANND